MFTDDYKKCTFTKVALCAIVLNWVSITNASAIPDIAKPLQGESLFKLLTDNRHDLLLQYKTELLPHTSQSAPSSGNNHDSINDLLIIQLQLDFGLIQLAEKTITSHLITNHDGDSLNQYIYRLAKLYYDDQKPIDTIRILDLIRSEADKNEFNTQYLRGLAYIDAGKFNAATELLNDLPLDNGTKEYISYNQGIALLLSGDSTTAETTLSTLCQANPKDEELLSLKDLCNLKLGYYFLETGQSEKAIRYFNHIRLSSPYTLQALLGSGWASYSLGDIKRAIVPWSLLHEYKIPDDSVYEVNMALPYAYASLGVHGKAVNLYGHAIDTIESELASLDESIGHIRRSDITNTIQDEAYISEKNWFITRLQQAKLDSRHLLTLAGNNRLMQLTENLQQMSLLHNHLRRWRPDSETKINRTDSTQSISVNKPVPSDTIERLIPIKAQLESIITDTHNKLLSLAVQILDHKRKKIQNYRDIAMHALSDSYDHVAGKKQ